MAESLEKAIEKKTDESMLRGLGKVRTEGDTRIWKDYQWQVWNELCFRGIEDKMWDFDLTVVKTTLAKGPKKVREPKNSGQSRASSLLRRHIDLEDPNADFVPECDEFDSTFECKDYGDWYTDGRLYRYHSTIIGTCYYFFLRNKVEGKVEKPIMCHINKTYETLYACTFNGQLYKYIDFPLNNISNVHGIPFKGGHCDTREKAIDLFLRFVNDEASLSDIGYSEKQLAIADLTASPKKTSNEKRDKVARQSKKNYKEEDEEKAPQKSLLDSKKKSKSSKKKTKKTKK